MTELVEVPVPEWVCQFDGPPVSFCLGQSYQTLAVFAGTKEEAIEGFRKVFSHIIWGVDQIAWRCRPTHEEFKPEGSEPASGLPIGRHKVRARFATHTYLTKKAQGVSQQDDIPNPTQTAYSYANGVLKNEHTYNV